LCQALSPANRGEVVRTLAQLDFAEKDATTSPTNPTKLDN